MRRRADRVAHVVQGVEDRGEVVAALEILRARGLEGEVGAPVGVLARMRDRRLVEIDADEARARKRIRP